MKIRFTITQIICLQVISFTFEKTFFLLQWVIFVWIYWHNSNSIAVVAAVVWISDTAEKQTVYTVKMLRKSLLNIGLRVSPQQHEGIHRVTAGLNPGNYGNIHRRDVSSTPATVMGDNVKIKTMDELGGPSFMTTLNWLFVKGYFQTTQQLQVSRLNGNECFCLVWCRMFCWYRFLGFHWPLFFFHLDFCTWIARPFKWL